MKVITLLQYYCYAKRWASIRPQVFDQREAKPKPIALRTRDFSRALSKLQLIAKNSDWFIALLTPVVIGQSNYWGIGYSTVVWKLLLQITVFRFCSATSVRLQKSARKSFDRSSWLSLFPSRTIFRIYFYRHSSALIRYFTVQLRKSSLEIFSRNTRGKVD